MSEPVLVYVRLGDFVRVNLVGAYCAPLRGKGCGLCLLCPSWHCVDDFFGIEDHRTAGSDFKPFLRVSEIHGLRTKEKKQQKPERSHRIQWVQVSISVKELEVAPLEDGRNCRKR